ncbi:MAG: hypothetical protein HY066_12635 [Betaproteobacteria bacterium]|nr:hypothetical protein [Betaproteobacteria bacterium]
MRMITRINKSESLDACSLRPRSPEGPPVTAPINQDLMDRLEPYKQQDNLSAQAEQLFARMLEELENRAWAE